MPKLVDALAGLRVKDEEEEAGLDLSQHSEAAIRIRTGDDGDNAM